MKIKVTRSGLTSCPSCLSHIEVAADLKSVTCPFCNTDLVVAIQGDAGAGAMNLLRNSRSGLVAAALAGLAFTACGTDDNNKKDSADAGGDTLIQEDVFEEPVNSDYAQAPVKTNATDEEAPKQAAPSDDSASG